MKRRIIAVSLALALCLIGVVSLCGCSNDGDEAILRSGITQELDSYKDADQSVVENFALDPRIQELSSFGIDPEEFIRTYLQGFDYSIDEVRIDETNAVVVVSLTCKNMNDFTQAFSAEKERLVSENAFAGKDQEEISRCIGQTAMDVLAELEPQTVSGIEIPCTLQDKTWTVTLEGEQNFTNSLIGVM